jgi:acyl carrier protein
MTQGNDTTTRIAQWVKLTFPLAAERQVGPEDSLLDGGIIDSMGTLEVVQFLEDEFGIQVSDEEMVADHFDSIQSISQYVDSKRQCRDAEAS